MATETITVVFTDLVGSTALLSRVGAARADALRREHFAMLRQAIARTDGREIKNLGDGLMIVYRSVTAALDAAVLMQKGIRRGSGDDALAMRVGVSHGEADVEAGDYFGPPVIEAARLCAVAADGQILCSDIVRMLAGSRTSHIFEPIGAIELKGFTEPVSACAVEWDVAVDEFRSAIPLPRRLEWANDASFVGRGEERMVLLEEWNRTVATNRCAAAFVTGDAGIGKTALLADIARTVYAEDGVVLYGRCDEQLSIPYQPWAEALGHLVAHAPADAIAPELARLVPLVPGTETESRRPPEVDPDAERYVLFAGVVELLAAVSAKSTVLLILDDVHWADGPTLQLLRYVAASDVPMRVQIVGAYRESDTGPTQPLTEMLAALRRDVPPRHVALHGLGDAELLAMVERFTGHELDDDGRVLRDALARDTDGNPLFVAEMLRHLAETGAITEHNGRWIVTSDLETTTLPVSVRDVIVGRVARLGERTVKVLSVAAVVGRDFSLPMVARMADVDEDLVLDTLERAVGAGLVSDRGADRFAFAHALVEHAMYDGLGATRRRRLHRSAAELIENETSGDPGDRVGELAHHWSEGAGTGDATKASDWACKAGDHALGGLAPEEARRWYLRADDVYAKSGLHDEQLRCRILLGLGQAQRHLGDAAHRQTLLDAAHLADEIGATPLLVRAALSNNRGWFSAAGTIDEERVDVLRRAIDRVGSSDTRSRASLLALLSLELSSLGPDPSERRMLADEAMALARTCGDPETLLRVLNNVYVAKSAADTHDERQAISREALVLARTSGDEISEFWATVLTLNGWAEASYSFRSLLDRCVAIADHIGQPTMRWMTSWLECCDASRRGDTQRADALAGDTLSIGLEAGEPDAMAVYGTQIAVVRWMQGRRAELTPVLAAVKPQLERLASFRALFAAAHLDAGDEDLAASLLSDELQVLPPRPPDVQWLCTALTWCDVAYRIDDRGAAGTLSEMLQPFALLFGFDGGSLYGSVADALARLAATTGEYGTAQTYLDIADELNTRLDAPFFVARTQLHRAQLYRRRDEDGDRESALVHATRALEIGQRHGFADVERAAGLVLGQ